MASPNRNSLLGWVKNLKKSALALNDSVNDISEADLSVVATKLPSKGVAPIPGASSFNPSSLDHQQLPLSHLDFLRPLLHHKSRSSNNVNRARLDSASNQLAADGFNIRQHRDSFLQHNLLVDENLAYFGVPLEDAIAQAAAKISIVKSDTSSEDVLQYGKIPIVVAKCGVFLKKNGLSVEGIFRVGGSSKRIKELQIIFNSPPDFGKRLSWDGYTVHDAASVLRRYLNALPEPLVSLDLYERFREPLRKRPRVVNFIRFKAENPNVSALAMPPSAIDTPSESINEPRLELDLAQDLDIPTSANSDSQIAPQLSVTDSAATSSATDARAASRPKSYKKLSRDIYDAIADYSVLLFELPNLQKQLLFYILDLLAMVQNNSSENLMSLRNLAAIFQPSVLSHPDHDMDPEEYVLSQLVVEFLIQYAYKLLPNDENNSATIEKSAPTTTRRHHSQSLSSTGANVDLIGLDSRHPSRKLSLSSDVEHGYGSASSDEDGSHLRNTGLPQPSGVRNLADVLSGEQAKPPIVVSEPAN